MVFSSFKLPGRWFATSIILIMWLSTCFNASCSSNDSPSESEIKVSVSEKNLTASSSASDVNLTVTVSRPWAIQSDCDWIRIRPQGGVGETPSTVRISVDANTSFEERVATLSILCGGKTVETVSLRQDCQRQALFSTESFICGGQSSEISVTVNANTDWTLASDASWIAVSPASGSNGETEVSLKVEANGSSTQREATISLSYGESKSELKVIQMSDEIIVPDGYNLVWHDEFNEGTTLGSDWTHEVQNAGWVNHELQNYVNGEVDGRRVTELKDGFLNINCFKGSDGKVYSGRVYAKVNSGWTYGYFEARIKLPKGKGTWPAFWMMPVGNDWNTNPWPKCGEIDIMEEVGADPNQVSSSLHTQNYNHTKGTQKTHAMNCSGAEEEFHVYALEWTENFINTYVDGKLQLSATKSSMGADHDSWPFHYAFYPILNLAWGGDWGGYKGVDDSALPVTMQIDYLRVFQKK